MGERSPAGRFDDHACGLTGHVNERLTHGCQGRLDPLAQVDVVESDNGEVIGDRQAAFAGCEVDSVCLLV